MNVILTMSSFIFPLISFRYVSNILSPVGTGKVAFATSIATYFVMLSQLGLPTYGVRTCAKVRDDKEKLSKTVHELLFINMIMSIISYVLFFSAIWFIPRLHNEKALFIVMSALVFFNMIGIEWLYKGLEQYTYITIRSIIFKFIALISMFLLIKTKSDYVIYGGLSILASCGSFVMNFIHSRKFITYKRFKNYNVRQHLKPVFVFFAMACATTIYTNLDNVMLGFMTSDYHTGVYDAAVKVKVILVSIVTSLGAVLLPRSSYFIKQGLMDEFRKCSRNALNFVCLISIPFIVFFMMFAEPCILILSSAVYIESVLPMRIILPTLFFIGLTNILGIQILVPTGRENTVLISEIVGAIVDVIINFALIPRYNVAGAAIGTLVAELFVLIVQYIALRKEVTSMLLSIQHYKILIATLISAIAAWPIMLLDLGQFAKLIFGAFVFFVIYLFIGILFKEQMIMELYSSVLKVIKRVTHNESK